VFVIFFFNGCVCNCRLGGRECVQTLAMFVNARSLFLFCSKKFIWVDFSFFQIEILILSLHWIYQL
jgi:hypothetical protein